MTDSENPQHDDEALDEVEALGGDDGIMESLPAEGSPLNGESHYNSMDEEGAFADGQAHDYSAHEPAPIDAEVDESSDDLTDETPDGALAYAIEGETDSPYTTDIDAAPAADDYASINDTYAVDNFGAYDFVDIEAALASVASLGDAAAEREVAEIAEQTAIETAEQEREEKRRPPRRVTAPPVLAMRRGHVASVVPALVLMLLGGWLTFAVTAPDAVPASPLHVILAAGGAVLVVLLAFWVASGRWARGVLFFALLALLTAGALYYETTLTVAYPVTGPLLLTAAGLAFALTGLLARPTDSRLLLPGILLLAAAGVNVAVAIGYLPDWLLTGAAAAWPLLVVVVIVLWLLPALFRRRA